MSERKVLNKYYPPDFDPSKIPRMKLAKNRQYTVRLMAPFNMRCKTCGEYIYKGKKFNARKEDVENETYLGIRIYRFYIKCTRCLQEISFKTDPKNTDYEIEAGATRNFMALKLAEEQARKEEEEAREEEANNPMKLLENRTQQSRSEIELLESLEELRDLNRRQHAVDYETMLQQYNSVETEKDRVRRQEQEDEEYIQSLKFKKASSGKKIVAEEIIEEIPESDSSSAVKADTATVKNTSVVNPSNTSTSSFATKVNLKRKQTLVLVKPKNASRTNQAAITKSNEAVIDDAGKVPSNPSPSVNATASEKRPSTSGLSLLAAYSDSSGAESN